MHLGNVYAALMAWLSARSAGGEFVLRIEDLDPRAQDPAKADLLMRDLEWLGLDWDNEPVYQSKRTELYKEAAGELAKKRLTYFCFCTRKDLHAASAPHASDGTYVYPGTCRNIPFDAMLDRARRQPCSVRLRVPDQNDLAGTIEFTDLCYGPQQEVLATDCGDFVIRRSDGVFAYQLAVVIDDALMGVSQVVRGRDLLGSCARQIYLARLLGYEPPTFGHVPLLVAPDGRRLSKREHDLDLGALREHGVSPQRIVGALTGIEGMPSELVDWFSWDRLRGQGDVVVDEKFMARLGA